MTPIYTTSYADANPIHKLRQERFPPSASFSQLNSQLDRSFPGLLSHLHYRSHQILAIC